MYIVYTTTGLALLMLLVWFGPRLFDKKKGQAKEESEWEIVPTYKIVYFGPIPRYNQGYTTRIFSGYSEGKYAWHDYRCEGANIWTGKVAASNSPEEIEDRFKKSTLYTMLPFIKYRVEVHTEGKLKSVAEEEYRESLRKARSSYNQRYTDYLEAELARMKELE